MNIKRKISTLLLLCAISAPFTQNARGEVSYNTYNQADTTRTEVADTAYFEWSDTALSRIKDSVHTREAATYTMQALPLLRIHRDYQAAKALLLKAIAADSTYAPAHFYLADVFDYSGAEQALSFAHNAYHLDTLNSWYAEKYAYDLYRNANNQEAINIYKKLSHEDPTNTSHLQFLSYLYRYEEQYANALDILDTLEIRAGASYNISAAKLELSRTINDVHRAEENATTLINLRPDDIELQIGVASVFFQMDADSIALKHILSAAEKGAQDTLEIRPQYALMEWYEKSKESLPHDVDMLLHASALFYSMGQSEIAYNNIKAAEKVDSTDIRPHMLLLEWFQREREYQQFFNHIDYIIARDDFSLEVKLDVFAQLVQQRNFYSLFFTNIDALASAMWAKHSDNEAVMAMYSAHMLACGRIDELYDIYNERISNNLTQRQKPIYDELTTLIDIGIHLKKAEEVAHFATQGAKYYPDSLNLYLSAGMGYVYDARGVEALEILKWAEKKTRSSRDIQAVIWGILGDVYQQIAAEEQIPSNRKKSVSLCYKAYEKSLAAHGDNPMILNNFAYAITQNNPSAQQLQRALQLSTKANELQPDQPSYIDTHAVVLYQLGEYDDAHTIIQRAIALGGENNPEILFHNAQILAALKDTFLAHIYLERAESAGYDKEIIKREIKRITTLTIEPYR